MSAAFGPGMQASSMPIQPFDSLKKSAFTFLNIEQCPKTEVSSGGWKAIPNGNSPGS